MAFFRYIPLDGKTLGSKKKSHIAMKEYASVVRTSNEKGEKGRAKSFSKKKHGKKR
jgi:hypothetical protein